MDIDPGDTRSLALTSLAEGVREKIERWKKAKLPLDELTAMVVAIEPSMATSVERRARLALTIDELVDAQIVRLPAAASYDQATLPRLPRFVWVQQPATSPTRTLGHAFGWSPDIAWAAELGLTDEQVALLTSVNNFLRDGGRNRPVVPIRERSLELLANEKRLESLLTGTMFADGRLTLELLRCRVVRPPFVFRRTGPGSTLLVIENHTTYDTISRHLDTDDEIGFVAYGAGHQFEASVSYVSELPQASERILYFGDLDDPGLSIALNAARNAAALGLPRIEPAASLYGLLFEYGHPTAWERATSQTRAQRLVSFLPRAHQARGLELLTQGQRLAQEAVGVEALMGRNRARWPA